MKRFQTVSLLRVTIAAAAFLSVGTAWADHFQGLGFLPGKSESYAWDISPEGTVVVGYSPEAGSIAFRWTAITGMQSIGTFPEETRNRHAYGVSLNGNVVVGQAYVPVPGTVIQPRAFRWTEATGMVNLGDLPGGVTRSIATGVSHDGNVVVGIGDYDFTAPRAFRWTEATGLVPLGIDNSQAWDVSADGSAVAGNTISTSIFPNRAFRWTISGGTEFLGDLPGGVIGSASHGISADGNTIVGYSLSGNGFEAFCWTAATGMVGLGDLTGGRFDSEAYAVSADGQIIVGSSIVGGPEFQPTFAAFIWTPEHGMRDLVAVLISDYGLGAELTGWQLTNATSISDDGRIIAGLGIDPTGKKQAWVVSVPEPSTVVLGAIAAAMLIVRYFARRRRAAG